MTKTILITGTSSGFGRETAERLARDGYRVFAAMRDIASRNRSHADALRSQKIGVVELDVTDDGSVDRAIASILAEAGKINVLVHNAGIASVGVAEGLTADQAKAILDTNVIGLLRVTRAVLPSMRREREGLIINMGSVLGRVTFPFVGIYRASKMAIEALTDSIRLEVSQLGVDVVEIRLALTRQACTRASSGLPTATSRNPTARSARFLTPFTRPSRQCCRVRTLRSLTTLPRPSPGSSARRRAVAPPGRWWARRLVLTRSMPTSRPSRRPSLAVWASGISKNSRD